MGTRKDVHLLVVGEPATDDDRRHAEEIRPIATERTTWLGYREDIPDILASVDVLVVNSDGEGGPRVVMEAMAAGKAVIATPVGYVPEVITHRINGFIVPRDDIECLRQVMTELITDDTLRGRLGDAARATAVRDFDCVEHSRNVIDELLALAARPST
jgi:glycosyltransferase involved in cell wall biosynthesis